MTIEVTQSDREMAAGITVLAELREIILSGRMDEHVNVQTIARARIAGWNAAVEKSAETASWAFPGHPITRREIKKKIRALRIEETNHDHP